MPPGSADSSKDGVLVGVYAWAGDIDREPLFVGRMAWDSYRKLRLAAKKGPIQFRLLSVAPAPRGDSESSELP